MLDLFFGDFSWSFAPPLVYCFMFGIVSLFDMFFRAQEICLFFLSFTPLECSWPACFSRTQNTVIGSGLATKIANGRVKSHAGLICYMRGATELPKGTI